MDELSVEEAISTYRTLPAGLPRLKYLRTLSNTILSHMGTKDASICYEMAEFNESPEGIAYWTGGEAQRDSEARRAHK